ncbi:hypothetical protein B0H11DRAFT_936915 [Mycena galericulata]|nr:hypothetical protein B0H11DRAFT_936915 [Mycena galericulata]
MFRARVPCRFFQEGRCRYGDECRFSHSPVAAAPRLPSFPPLHYPAGNPLAMRSYSTTPPPARPSNGTRVYESDTKDASLKLFEAINSLRTSAGQEELERTNKFFEILEVAVCRLEEEELEAATDALREAFTFDYHSRGNSPEGSDYGYGDSDDEDDDGFGDMDFFSPLKKSTPQYREPVFSARQTAYYQRNSYSQHNNIRRETFFDWALLEDNPSAFNVQFGVNFSIEDSHIAGFSARPDICRRLQRFAAGDTNTGNGGGVHDEPAFIQFVRLCSSMRVFRLEAFTSLSDATLLAIFEACPRIEMVQLTGHDKSSGKVTGTALRKLARTPSWAPNLKALYLLDQTHTLDASVKALSAARPTVWIFTGETLGESMSAQIVASMDGGADSHTWLGGKIVSISNDCGTLAPRRSDYLDMEPW